MDLGLKDATATVVGGGRGMGLATARCLADEGARVAVVGRSRDVLEQVAGELTRRGSPDAVGLVADAGDAGQVEKLFTGSGPARWAASKTSPTTSGARPSTTG
jgi:3-oxoacyl-[acyl-carrier protein] reductase